ncbi:carbohydrate sulfotransferase 14-like [Amphiura filiformis]|uniref:carbohydrate sulfotransferase 14-like n=1 Tax=Amphiura filiformis TaxID=82378 RepID=UPI003B20E8EF
MDNNQVPGIETTNNYKIKNTEIRRQTQVKDIMITNQLRTATPVSHEFTSSHGSKDIDNRQRKRIKYKNAICLEVYQTMPPSPLTKENLQIDKGANFETTYYNAEFNFFISTSWKVGSTNWLNAMRRLHDKTTSQKSNHTDVVIPILGNLNSYEFNARIEYYFKAIFVRNPLARLISAYRDKLVENKNRIVYRDLASNIVKLYRKGATVEEIESGNVTFPEFAQFVVDTYPKKIDPHWYPVVDRLKPCLIPYDFIGKMETIDTDSDYLFRKLKVDKLISLGTSYSHGRSGQIDLIRKYYEKLTVELFDKVLTMYEADFEVFGYRIPRNQTDFTTEEDLIGV